MPPMKKEFHERGENDVDTCRCTKSTLYILSKPKNIEYTAKIVNLVAHPVT